MSSDPSIFEVWYKSNVLRRFLLNCPKAIKWFFTRDEFPNVFVKTRLRRFFECFVYDYKGWTRRDYETLSCGEPE